MIKIEFDDVSYEELKQFYLKLEADRSACGKLEHEHFLKYGYGFEPNSPDFVEPKCSYEIKNIYITNVPAKGIKLEYTPTTQMFKLVNEELIFESYKVTISYHWR